MSEATLATRLRGLPRVQVMGREVRVATGLRARLLGLVGLEHAEAGGGLLIPRCTSVHTFGMRFALDLCFLDGGGEALVWRLAVPPRKLAFCAGASAVLELPVQEGGEISAGLS